MIFGYHLNIALIYLILLHSKMKGKFWVNYLNKKTRERRQMFALRTTEFLLGLKFTYLILERLKGYIVNSSANFYPNLLSLAVYDMVRKQRARKTSPLFFSAHHAHF